MPVEETGSTCQGIAHILDFVNYIFAGSQNMLLHPCISYTLVARVEACPDAGLTFNYDKNILGWGGG